jgi:hypothetical protein
MPRPTKLNIWQTADLERLIVIRKSLIALTLGASLAAAAPAAFAANISAPAKPAASSTMADTAAKPAPKKVVKHKKHKPAAATVKTETPKSN